MSQPKKQWWSKKMTIFLLSIILGLCGAFALLTGWDNLEESTRSTVLWALAIFCGVVVTVGIIPTIYFVGIKKGRFFSKVGTGNVIAYGRGGAIDHYVITRKDYDMIMAKIESEIVRVSEWTHVDLKNEAVTKLEAWKTKMESGLIKIAGGILWMFGYHTLSYWNPAVKLIKSDRNTGETNVGFITSYNLQFDGIDISGPGGSGSYPVTVRAEAREVVFLDFFRIFFVEQSTVAQVKDRTNAAVNILCGGIDIDDLENRRFKDKSVEKATLSLIDFGLIPGILSIIDFSFDDSPLKATLNEKARVAEEIEIAKLAAEKARKEAEGRRDARKTEADGHRYEIKEKGLATAEAAEALIKAIKKVPPDIARLVVAPNNPTAGVPVGADYYAIGDAKAPEVWVEAKKGGENNK